MKKWNKEDGYPQKEFLLPRKRYCQTLELKKDQHLIDEYVKVHSALYHWPEIREGIRAVGILEMEIYRLDTTLFMVVETPIDFDWGKAFAELSNLPRQEEWEAFVASFQYLTEDNGSSLEKWKLMDRMFYLYD